MSDAPPRSWIYEIRAERDALREEVKRLRALLRRAVGRPECAKLILDETWIEDARAALGGDT